MKAGEFQQLGVDFMYFLPYLLNAFEDPLNQKRLASENQAKKKDDQEGGSQ
jgi:hypothetical protein